jgi:hypothetical protein
LRYAGVYRMSGTALAYDVHPDGKRFIMVSEAEGSGDAGMGAVYRPHDPRLRRGGLDLYDKARSTRRRVSRALLRRSK